MGGLVSMKNFFSEAFLQNIFRISKCFLSLYTEF